MLKHIFTSSNNTLDQNAYLKHQAQRIGLQCQVELELEHPQTQKCLTIVGELSFRLPYLPLRTQSKEHFWAWLSMVVDRKPVPQRIQAHNIRLSVANYKTWTSLEKHGFMYIDDRRPLLPAEQMDRICLKHNAGSAEPEDVRSIYKHHVELVSYLPLTSSSMAVDDCCRLFKANLPAFMGSVRDHILFVGRTAPHFLQVLKKMTELSTM